jgi:hypothetical protein
MRICGHTIESNYHKYATPTGDQLKALAGLFRKRWTALRHNSRPMNKGSLGNSPAR